MIGAPREPVAGATPARPGARPDALQLTRALGAFRRRRRRVLAIRFACTGLALAVVAGEALSLALRAGTDYTIWLLAGAAGVAVIVSILAAAVHTPSLPDTARLLDRHALLLNRAATALQFVDNDDVMATLVVRDAARRMSGLDPAMVFPREYPARPHLLVAAVTVSALLFAASVSRVAWAPQSSSRSAGMAVPGAPAEARPGSPGLRQADTPGATPAQGSALSPVPQDTQAGANDRRTPQDQTADREARADGRAGSPARSPSANQQGAGAGSQRRSPTSTGSATASDRPGAGDSGAASPARDPRAAAGEGEGAGQGGGVPDRATRAGGGIKGGALAGPIPAAPARRDTGRTQGYAVEYQAAWARAQAALAQDRVPPPLREYVRRYFDAIRSPKEP